MFLIPPTCSAGLKFDTKMNTGNDSHSLRR